MLAAAITEMAMKAIEGEDLGTRQSEAVGSW